MNTSMTMNQPGGTRRWKLLIGIVAAGLLVGGLTACRTTHQVGESEKDFSGFLGDYSMLTKGDGNEANYIYIDRSVNWAKYTKVYIKNIDLWKSEDTNSPFGNMDSAQQQMLVNFAHTAIAEALQTNFTIVDQAGPDTLVIHAALTEAKKSRPVSNLVSSVVPMGIGLSLVKRVIFGTGLGVGECQAEAEFMDGGNGQIVCEAVDRRAGTKALRTKFDGTFGDVKLCMDYWSQRAAFKLEQLRVNSADKSEM